MKLGLIGGLGPESTIEYYKELVYKYEDVKGEFPEVIIESLDVNKTLKLCETKERESLLNYLLKALDNLYKGGADFGAISANTPHLVFNELREKSPMPLISIVEETCKAVMKDNIKKVGLLGTIMTMETDFYKKEFAKHNIDVIVPDKEAREFVNNKINSELEKGIFKDETRKDIVKVIYKMVREEHIEGVILGCTELPILFKNSKEDFKIYDTVNIHVDSILNKMVKNNKNVL